MKYTHLKILSTKTYATAMKCMTIRGKTSSALYVSVNHRTWLIPIDYSK